MSWRRDVLLRARAALTPICRLFLPSAAVLLLCGCEGGEQSLPLAGPSDAHILRSTLVSPGQTLHAVADVGQGRLVAVGESGTILVSSDEGKSFGPPPTGSAKRFWWNSLHSVIADEQGNIVVVGGEILASRDGGRTFTPALRSGDASKELASVTTDGQGHTVAVGTDGAIVVSGDGGKTFAPPPGGTGTERTLSSVTSDGHGHVVAVGAGASVFSSDGGKSFAPARAGSVSPSVYLRRVTAVGKGRFVAVGDGGTILLSRDGGESFAPPPQGSRTTANLRGVAVDEQGRIVAVGARGAIVVSRNGGTAFAPPPGGSGTTRDLDDVAIDPQGQIVAVGAEIVVSGNGGDRFAPPPKGSGTNRTLNGVTVDVHGRIVAVGTAGAIVVSRDRGETFASPIGGSSIQGDLMSVASDGPGHFVAVGQGGTIVVSGDGGKTFAPPAVDGGTKGDLRRVAADDHGHIVAVGDEIVWSNDRGEHFAPAQRWKWREAALFYPRFFGLATDGHGLFVAVGEATVVSTNGGEGFTPANVGETMFFRSIAPLGRGQFVALDLQGRILVSGDGGVRFAPAKSPEDHSLAGAAADGQGHVVAVGADGFIVVSDDGGSHFVAAPGVSGVTNDLRSVVSDGPGHFVAVGEGGAVLVSGDGGKTFALPPGGSGTTRSLNSVVSDGRGLVAAAGDEIVVSRDGGRSFARPSGEEGRTGFSSVASDGQGQFAAVGRDGKWVRVEAGPPAPCIREVRHRYVRSARGPAGLPAISLRFDAPGAECARGECIDIAVATEQQRKLGSAPTPLPANLREMRPNGTLDVTFPPSLIETRSGKSFFARIKVAVDGYSYTYGDPGNADGYLTIPNNPSPVWRQAWVLPLTAVAAVAGFLVLALFVRPLGLLALTQGASVAGELATDSGLAWARLPVALARLVLLPLLTRAPHVLDAWVIKHQQVFAEGLERAARAAAGRVPMYVPLPVEREGAGIITEPSPDSIGSLLRSRPCCIELIGVGGSGKTRLAIEIARWVLGQGAAPLLSHTAVPVFIDEEFGDLKRLVSAKIRALTGQELPDAFLTALIERGRVVPVVDRVSERTAVTQEAVRLVYRSITPGVMLLTARSTITIADSPREPVAVKMLPLDAQTIPLFLSAQLADQKAGEVFPDLAAQVDLQARFVRQITVDRHQLSVTPLLVMLFAEQAVVLGHEGRSIEELPTSVPEAYFRYIEQLDATRAAGRATSSTELSALQGLAVEMARLELAEDFRPKEMSRAAAETTLVRTGRYTQEAVAQHVGALIQNGIITEQRTGDTTTIKFILDPLAECLAAHGHAKAAGADAAAWERLVDRARGLGAEGFLQALHMNYAAYRGKPGYPFPERGW
jgi:photosystem II stability/assembly factor-like uncharacterized protein